MVAGGTAAGFACELATAHRGNRASEVSRRQQVSPHEDERDAAAGAAAVNTRAGGALCGLRVGGWRGFLEAGRAPGATACQCPAAPEAAAAWDLHLPGPSGTGRGGPGEQVSITWRSHRSSGVGISQKPLACWSSEG